MVGYNLLRKLLLKYFTIEYTRLVESNITPYIVMTSGFHK